MQKILLELVLPDFSALETYFNNFGYKTCNKLYYNICLFSFNPFEHIAHSKFSSKTRTRRVLGFWKIKNQPNLAKKLNKFCFIPKSATFLHLQKINMNCFDSYSIDTETLCKWPKICAKWHIKLIWIVKFRQNMHKIGENKMF